MQTEELTESRVHMHLTYQLCHQPYHHFTLIFWLLLMIACTAFLYTSSYCSHPNRMWYGDPYLYFWIESWLLRSRLKFTCSYSSTWFSLLFLLSLNQLLFYVRWTILSVTKIALNRSHRVHLIWINQKYIFWEINRKRIICKTYILTWVGR